MAFHVSDQIGHGKLIIANRTLAQAQSLAGEITKLGRQAIAIDEEDVSIWAPKVGLIVNSTTKGQGGVRKLSNGMATMLAPYSALAPAQPPLLAESLGDGFESAMARGGSATTSKPTTEAPKPWPQRFPSRRASTI